MRCASAAVKEEKCRSSQEDGELLASKRESSKLNAGAPVWYQEAWPRWRHTRGHSCTHADWAGRYLTVTGEIWHHISSPCWDSLNRFKVLVTWHIPLHWTTVNLWVLDLWILTQCVWPGLDVAMICLWGLLKCSLIHQLSDSVCAIPGSAYERPQLCRCWDKSIKINDCSVQLLNPIKLKTAGMHLLLEDISNCTPLSGSKSGKPAFVYAFHTSLGTFLTTHHGATSVIPLKKFNLTSVAKKL